MSKQTVIIYGGAFDPPHRGHEVLIRAALNLHPVWIMPSYFDPFGKEMTHAADRYNMCQLMADQTGAQVSAFELVNRLVNGTYDMVCQLREAFDYNFKVLIGMDQAKCIHEWRHADALLKEVVFVTADRKGEDENDDRWYERSPHCRIHVPNLVDISSTQIRNELRIANSKVGKCVNPQVLQYIRKNHLYEPVHA